MAGKIKGITISIGGETTGLQKALADVNKKTKDLSAELRATERLLKLDPSNTTLLAQKQKLLADAVENSREKLDRLKTAQEQVNEQFRKGEINEEQYRAFQREVVKAEQELAKFEKQLRDTGITAEKVGQKLKDAGQKMTDVGKNLTMRVTAPVLATGAAATKLGMDFEAAMSEVGAISGATGEELEALEAKAKELGATTKFSATEAAEGLKYMAMAGWDVQQQLDGLPGVLSLAAASGESLGAVSDIVTDAMTAFGMEAARAAEFADILAAASSNANTNVGMLGESFKYVAPVAGSLGYEAKDVAIGLGLMANAGIKASQAGTAMRSMLTRLVKPTKESGMAMDQLGISLTDSEGRMKSFAQIMDDLRGAFQKLDPDQQAFYAAQIAGQEAMSGLLAIVNASEADYTKLSDAINNSTGAAQRMAKEMQDNLSGRLTELKSALEGVALQLYDHLQPALENLIEIVRKVVDWFANLSPEAQKVIVIIAGLAAAIGPLLVVLGVLASSIGSIIAIAPTLGAALTALTGPIGIIIAAVTALIAIWVKWGDDIKRIIGEVVAKATEWFGNIQDKAIELWTNIQFKTSEIWGAIKNFLSTLWNNIKTTAETLFTAIKTAIETITNNINTVITTIWTKISSFLSTTLGSIKARFDEIWGAIKTATEKTWEAVKDTIKTAINGIIGFINKLIKAWNKIEFTIPEVDVPFVGTFGGFTVRVPQIPEIPKLARGGIVTKEMLALVGEKGPEAVVPIDRLENMLAKIMQEQKGRGDIHQIVNVHSPVPLTPYETARQIKNASRQLAMEW